ncbi:MAG: 30S ribosomal protein S14 [Acidobacteria bacterium]|nr:MAG: 30S ribosomal protein S14 [Acidobacteriota bacterium]REK02532.1 MAG: 30S ribosomal protein S14 [Acidobacteriota bacterium]REK13665.1 MAG: 30S ribosomal protein S14 [Acidobacteriota bacterium]REK41659.1 MAG: 30S ribosomal protein S14 [Acidobacteriota bacterium]
MAKVSKIVKNQKRKKLVARYAEKRKALKKIINNPDSTPEEVDDAVIRLQKLPRDASPVRVVNRCSQTGRPRGYLRKFGISRVALRELALEGQIPGVVKSSW